MKEASFSEALLNAGQPEVSVEKPSTCCPVGGPYLVFAGTAADERVLEVLARPLAADLLWPDSSPLSLPFLLVVMVSPPLSASFAAAQ